MLLTKQVAADYLTAFKAGQKIKVEVLRILRAAFQQAEIAKRGQTGKREVELSAEEALAVVRRQIKQAEEALVLFQQGGREDLVAQTATELKFLRAYAPAQMSEAQVREVVKQVLAEFKPVSAADFSRVMGVVMKQLGGQAEGTIVSRLVKEYLTK